MIYYLKPCPFCGRKAHLVTMELLDGSEMYSVDCDNDGCAVSPYTPLCNTETEAVEVWNRRSYDASQPV